jgi:hypothetical protein
MLGLCLLGGAVVSGASFGCRPATGARSAKLRLDAEQLSGIWVGVRRDAPDAGIRRATSLLLELEADVKGGVGGSLELHGALGTGAERKLSCTKKRRARLALQAKLTQGRYETKSAQFRLGTPKADGEKACRHRFPLGQTCQAEVGEGRTLRVRCGQMELPVHRARLDGVWVWDQERTERSGDTIIRRLRLHLTQATDRLRGFIDDIRVRISNDGQRYRCNGRLRYEQQARHEVRGRLRGRRLTLDVRASVPKRGPCQGRVALPKSIAGTWEPLDDRLTLKVSGDERVLWRRPASPQHRSARGAHK